MKFQLDDFRQNVYAVVAAIPPGRVLTYGDVARLAGWPLHSRWVGRVLSQVPDNLHLPCHRVVNHTGRLAPSWDEQAWLLAAEGVRLKSNGCVDLNTYRWKVEKIIAQ